MKLYFTLEINDLTNNHNVVNEIENWEKYINELIEILTKLDLDVRYKKDIIDLAFDRGHLSRMSNTAKEELRSKFHYKYLSNS